MAGAAFLAVTMFFWGTSYRAAAIGAEHASPLMLTALRAAPATLALVLAATVLRTRIPGRSLLGWTVATGLLMVVVPLEGINEGAARAGPANAAILTNASPFFVLLLGRILFGERASPLAITGLCTGFAGCVVMVWSQIGGVEDTSDFVLGMAVGLATALAWAVGVLMCKVLFTRHPDTDVLGLTVGQYLVGAPILVALAFGIEGTGSTAWGSGDLWGAAAWLALGGSGIATLTFFAALKRTSALTVTSWQFLAPVVAVVVEAVLGDAPGPTVLVGMVVAIAGVALVSAAPALAVRKRGLGHA